MPLLKRIRTKFSGADAHVGKWKPQPCGLRKLMRNKRPIVAA